MPAVRGQETEERVLEGADRGVAMEPGQHPAGSQAEMGANGVVKEGLVQCCRKARKVAISRGVGDRTGGRRAAEAERAGSSVVWGARRLPCSPPQPRARPQSLQTCQLQEVCVRPFSSAQMGRFAHVPRDVHFRVDWWHEPAPCKLHSGLELLASLAQGLCGGSVTHLSPVSLR